MKIEIFDIKYAEEVSNIIVDNLLHVNIQHYNLKDMQEMAKKHSPEQIFNLSKERYMIVATENEKAVGVASIYPLIKNNELYFMIASFFISPNLQGKGIGKALFEDLKRYATYYNPTAFFVDASLTSPVFYEKLGFAYEFGKKEISIEQNYKMLYCL